MDRVNKIKCLAEDNLYKSVIKINDNLLEECETKDEDFLSFGIKNTNDIPRDLIDKLRNNKKYLWTTIDRMAHLGRSIDTELTNPLTYRCMTGSTSGGPINILKGINDFAIGTDGGGSVLAPAISCNLYSFLGTGAGLTIKKQGKSTDNIEFLPGIGFISKDYCTLKTVVQDVLDIEIKEYTKKIKVVIPHSGVATTSDNRDMNSILKSYLNKTNEDLNIEIVEYKFKNINDRTSSVNDIKNIFEGKIGDLILTFEGPIDVLGYDETIQRSFNGNVEKEITSNGGKALVKAANICKCTGITIPTENLAAGLLVCAPEGVENIQTAFCLAEELNNIINLPEIFYKYFINREKFVQPSLYR